MKMVSASALQSMIVIAAAVSVPRGEALCHGAACRLMEGAAAVEATYHDGSPMAFCDVYLFGPGDTAFTIAGETDSLGTFAFAPGRNGTWKIRVDDGLGHIARLDIETEPSGETAAGRGRTGILGGTVLGLGVIFGLFGLIAIIRSRKPAGAGRGRHCGSG